MGPLTAWFCRTAEWLDDQPELAAMGSLEEAELRALLGDLAEPEDAESA